MVLLFFLCLAPKPFRGHEWPLFYQESTQQSALNNQPEQVRESEQICGTVSSIAYFALAVSL